MRITSEDRKRAAARFNVMAPGYRFEPVDMALFDVYFTGWPEGAVPARSWLPTRGLSANVAAGLAQGVATQNVSHVVRLCTDVERMIEGQPNDAAPLRSNG